MKNRMKHNRNSGFTLLEVLIAVGILVILLSVSVVGIARYVDVLSVAELDNAARDIFLAAENRAVLLSASQELDSLVRDSAVGPVELTGGGHAEGEKLYCVSLGSVTEDLLPKGGIRPDLLTDGDFYIVYSLATVGEDDDPIYIGTGSVTDVFYAEGVDTLTDLVAEQAGDVLGDKFETFYASWASDRSNRIRLKNTQTNPDKTLVGWHNGLAAEGGSTPPDIREKYFDVTIVNNERLTVTLTVRGEYAEGIEVGLSNLSVRLGPAGAQELGDGNSLKLDFPDEIKVRPVGDPFIYTWTLDSLEPDEQKFKDLVKDIEEITPGDEIKVEATLTVTSTKNGSIVETEISDKDENNSLFWKDSGGQVARIRYLRHLQNLDVDNGYNSGLRDSGPSAKTSAVQISDILVYNNGTYENYWFIPIHNESLCAYDGGSWTIQNLKVDLTDEDGAAAAGKIKDADEDADEDEDEVFLGLFRETPEHASEVTFENIRLVNTTVKAADGTSSTAVGALVGKTSGAYTTNITNCWVYWDVTALPDDEGMQDVLGNNGDGEDHYKYQLVGNTAGGLVGSAEGTIKIKNSLASTLIKGTVVGGLVGRMDGAWNTVDNSYTDSYLTGEHAAGLVGYVKRVANNDDADLTVANCYTTGYIMDGTHVAGLCLGGGKTVTNHVYAAMRYPGWGITGVTLVDDNSVVIKWRYFLTAGIETDGSGEYDQNKYKNFDVFEDTYFLGPGSEVVKSFDGTTSNEDVVGSAFDQMTDRKGKVKDNNDKDFATLLGDDSGNTAFDWRYSGDGNSHPYNLRQYQTLTVYEYPGLKDTDGNAMPHYGDWGSEFKEPSLVYYEQYTSDKDDDGNDIEDENDKVSWGVSGGNARGLYNSLRDDQTVPKDGYGVAFLASELKQIRESNPDGVDIRIKLWYFDDTTKTEKNWQGVNGSYGANMQATKSVSEVVNETTGATETFWYFSEDDLYTSWVNQDTEAEDDDSNTSSVHKDGKVLLYVIPLPDALVDTAYAYREFYQFFRFELILGKVGYEDVSSEGVFFYNPHFAETVEPYIAEGRSSSSWTWADVQTTAAALESNLNTVNIRTARHLYDLSAFDKVYYRYKRYTFRQSLDLDYATYTGYQKGNDKFIQALADENGVIVPYEQDPIGASTVPFQGTYQGECNTIRNVRPKIMLTQTNQYVGLFGYSTGTLRNIVYEMNPNYTLTSMVRYAAGGMYFGALSGISSGLIENCAVHGVRIYIQATGVNLYAGGLVGLNSGTLRSSAAEVAELEAESNPATHVYLGGLVGQNGKNGSITTSYAVGRISATAINGGEGDICGFVGENTGATGAVSASYAAVDLQYSGNVRTYGFSRGVDPNMDLHYLDHGSFYYRGSGFAVDYGTVGNTLYKGLTGDLTNTDEMIHGTAASLVVGGMSWVELNDDQKERYDQSPQRTGEEDEALYPYPTAVVDKKGKPIHYGQWPGAVPLGDFGVFYWEKLEEIDNPDNYTYHFDALAVDSQKQLISEQSTLTNAYEDGRVVAAYGYGYYYKGTNAPEFSAKGLGYFVYTPDVLTAPGNANKLGSSKVVGKVNYYYGVESSDGTYTGGELVQDRTKKVEALNEVNSNRNLNRNQLPADYNKTVGILEDDDTVSVMGSNAELRSIIPGDFMVVSWDSYREGGRPSTGWSGTTTSTNLANYTSERKKQSTAGIVPNYNGGSAAAAGTWNSAKDGTFTLRNDNVEVTFVVDPHFAAALSVESVNGRTDLARTWTNYNTKLTTVPGSSNANPFQIRCGTQLQEINTSTSFYTDFCIGMGGPFAMYENKYWDLPTAERFPYLSSVNFYTDTSTYSLFSSSDTSTNAKRLGSVVENDHKWYRYNYFVQTHDIDWVAEGNTYYICKTCRPTGTDENGKPIYQGFSHAGKEQHGAANQTHVMEEMPGVFTPIAAAAGRMAQNVFNLVDMPGWFAGSYDGQHYVLKNLNIDINSEDFNTSCIGLFGAIYNNKASDSAKCPDQTVLKGIVLYSEEESVVTVRGRKAGNSRDPGGGAYTCTVRWYAGGVLVGAALGGCEISDCAVSGYTIIDQTRSGADNVGYLGRATNQHNTTTKSSWTYQYGNGFTAPKTAESVIHYGPSGEEVSRSTGVRAWGVVRDVRTTKNNNTTANSANNGYSTLTNTNSEIIAGAIGGMVGLTDGDLMGCAAVTNIKMQPNHIDINSTTAGTARVPEGVSELENAQATLLFVDCGEGSPVRAGGLVGSTIGNVTNCYTGGEITVNTSTYRVTDAITGETRTTNRPWTAHCALNIGRIVGGVGAGVFVEKSGETSASVANCYSYMIIPDNSLNIEYSSANKGSYVQNGNSGYDYNDQFIYTRYPIGGVGPGGYGSDGGTGSTVINLSNNYWLEGTGNITDTLNRPSRTVNSNYEDDRRRLPTNPGTSISYQRLAGLVSMSDGALAYDGNGVCTNDIFATLNGYAAGTGYTNLDGSGAPYFNPVTADVGTDGSFPIPGRYTFVPASYEYLQSLDYPFPAVLWQEREGFGKVYVHYGTWGYRGIRRDTGALPITLDLLKVGDGEPEGTPAGTHVETLKLENLNAGGTWGPREVKIEEVDENGRKVEKTALVVEFVKLSDTEYRMTVTAQRNIDVPQVVTLPVTYVLNGVTYSLDIPVNIVAGIDLTPSDLKMYPDDKATLTLSPSFNLMPGYELAFEKVECVSGALATSGEMVGNNIAITMTRTGPEFSGTTAWVDVTYSYMKPGTDGADAEYIAQSNVKRLYVDMLRMLPEGKWTMQNVDGALLWTWSLDFTGRELLPAGNIQMINIRNNAIEEVGIIKHYGFTGNVFTFIVSDISKIYDDIELQFAVEMDDGLTHTLNITIPRPRLPEEIEAVGTVGEPDASGKRTIVWTVDLYGNDYLISENADRALREAVRAEGFEFNSIAFSGGFIDSFTMSWTGEVPAYGPPPYPSVLTLLFDVTGITDQPETAILRIRLRDGDEAYPGPEPGSEITIEIVARPSETPVGGTKRMMFWTIDLLTEEGGYQFDRNSFEDALRDALRAVESMQSMHIDGVGEENGFIAWFDLRWDHVYEAGNPPRDYPDKLELTLNMAGEGVVQTINLIITLPPLEAGSYAGILELPVDGWNLETPALPDNTPLEPVAEPEELDDPNDPNADVPDEEDPDENEPDGEDPDGEDAD